MAEALTPRGIHACRLCGSDGLVSVLDLGEQPLANEMGLFADEELPRFPLHLRICPDCGLGQVGEFVLPERLFGDNYPYLSSTSKIWLDHCRAYAARFSAELALGAGDLVVEVASNDGALLRAMQEHGVNVLGVEPAANVAKLAEAAGVPTVVEFFGAAAAERIVAEHGHPKLVAANNVMAHVPDVHDFMAGFAVLADADTVITVENPSMMSLLHHTQFDTIYHEHYSYLTAHSVRHLAQAHGLDLVHVDQTSTHGGSNRYRLSRTRQPDASVEAVLDDERRGGLFDPTVWRDFASRSQAAIAGLRAWLTECQASGETVAGYGAAAKGNTFLNAVGDAARTLTYVVDGSREKQGKFLPGTQALVIAPDEMSARPVDHVLILPWNISSELRELVGQFLPLARVWVALPGMRELT
jgi:hypothetical protein